MSHTSLSSLPLLATLKCLAQFFFVMSISKSEERRYRPVSMFIVSYMDDIIFGRKKIGPPTFLQSYILVRTLVCAYCNYRFRIIRIKYVCSTFNY
jgi:hypothetical protein